MRPTQLLIDLNALKDNVKLLQKKAAGANLVAVIKANAYGHDAIEVAKALTGLVNLFAVASIDEAITLKEAGINTPILLLEGVFEKNEWDLVQDYQFASVIHHQAQIDSLIATNPKKPIDIWLKHNSGMNRLGFNETGFLNAYQQLSESSFITPPLKLMSHLATADDLAHSQLKAQLKAFNALTMPLKGARSLANSAGIFAGKDFHFDWVRAGLAIYGASPLKDKSAKALGLKPVMTLTSKIIAIQNCKAYESVGYGADYIVKKPSKIAVVAIGYGDGYPRHINDAAYVLVEGQKAPIVGRVSMDMLTIDISHIKSANIDSIVVLWGEGLTIEKVAAFSKTINYDLLTRAGLRAKKVFMENY